MSGPMDIVDALAEASEALEDSPPCYLSPAALRTILDALARADASVTAADKMAAEVKADLADEDSAPLHAQLRSRVAIADYEKTRGA